MSVSAAAVMTVLLAHKPWLDRDMSTTEREHVLQPVAEAIADVSRNELDAAVLLSLGWHETKFASLVLTGRCREMPEGQRCDSGKARGVWSLHAEACRDAWALAAGSVESVRAEARCALRLLRFHAYRCREHSISPLFGAFSGYSGAGCHWGQAEQRVATVQRFAAELARAEAA